MSTDLTAQRILAFGTRGAQGSGLVEAIDAAGATPIRVSSSTQTVQGWVDAGHAATRIDLADPHAAVAAAREAGADAAVLHIPFSMSGAGTGLQAARSAIALREAGMAVSVNVGTALPRPGMADPFGTGPLVELLTQGGATVLGVTAYLENLAAPWSAAAVASGELRYPRPADDPIAWIASRDVSAAGVAALRGDPGQAHQLAGPEILTFTELADALAAGLGHDVAFVRVSASEFAESARPFVGDGPARGIEQAYGSMPEEPNPAMAIDASATWAALGVTPTDASSWASAVMAPGRHELA